MQQKNHLDPIVLEKIKNGDIIVDVENGHVFGKRKDVYGKRRPIGFVNKKSGYFLFSFIHEGISLSYYVCRAVYIAYTKKPLIGKIVINIDGNKLNNSINNLDVILISIENTHKNRWTESEDEFVVKNYLTMSYKEIANKLDRTVRAVSHKVNNLKLSNKLIKKYKWSVYDDNKLLKLYKNKSLSIDNIAYNMKRSHASVRLRLNRSLNANRSDIHLRDLKNSKNFYAALKGANQRGSLWVKCCLCTYSKYIQLHHINGHNNHNKIYNISTLCPNHHVEVEHDEHQIENLYAIWARKYSDGSLGKIKNNRKEIEMFSRGIKFK